MGITTSPGGGLCTTGETKRGRVVPVLPCSGNTLRGSRGFRKHRCILVREDIEAEGRGDADEWCVAKACTGTLVEVK